MITKVTYQRKYLLPNNEYEYLSAEATYSDTCPESGSEMMEDCRRCCAENSREYLLRVAKEGSSKKVVVKGEVSS